MAAQTNKSIAPTKVVSFLVVAGSAAVANQNSDTPTNVVEIARGGADGTRLTKLKGVPRDTSIASRVLLFRSTDGGTTKRLIGSVTVTAYTWSTTTEPTSAQVVDFLLSEATPKFLKDANDRLYVGFAVSQTADRWVFEGEGGEYGTAP